jgi:3-oxoacyl-[acyl-carrier-protein] synthase I
MSDAASRAPRVHVHASSLVSCCGIGWAAHRAALRDAASGLAPNDFAPASEIATWIGRVDGVEAVSVPPPLHDCDCRNNRLALLALQQDGLAEAIAQAARRHGRDRIGVVVGTSTSGILSTELAVRAAAAAGIAARFAPGYYDDCHNMFATARFVRAWCRLEGPALTISTACSSSAKAFVTARRWIALRRCDAVVVAGVDSLALSTLHGFRALQLLSSERCRPFAATRAGISIGEAAAIALLEAAPSDVALAGAGETCDAHHMSTPPADGEGARRAMQAALADAGLDAAAIDYINLHGTGTRVNDAAEAAAVHALFGAHAAASSTKGATGHTLGAAGALEALLCVAALREGLVPANVGGETSDPALPLAPASAPRMAPLRHALTNSFGFGGSNCTLIFARA